MAAPLPDGASTLRQAIEAAGIDPRGIDIAWLSHIKAETETRIAAHSDEFADDAPGFDPPLAQGGTRDAT